jgi:hypothetical protein
MPCAYGESFFSASSISDPEMGRRGRAPRGTRVWSACTLKRWRCETTSAPRIPFSDGHVLSDKLSLLPKICGCCPTYTIYGVSNAEQLYTVISEGLWALNSDAYLSSLLGQVLLLSALSTRNDLFFISDVNAEHVNTHVLQYFATSEYSVAPSNR